MVLPEAIIAAAWEGNVAAIEQWLNAGGDANERCEGSGESILHLVADRILCSDEVERGRCDIARLLLARGAEVDLVSTPSLPVAKNTPLFIAAIYRRIELCKVLCEAGADPNYKREEGDFPLWVACENPATLRVLLSFGADPSQRLSIYPGTARAEMRLPEVNAARGGFDESFRLLRDARLLRPRLRAIFALRALCHRGRAAPTAATPSAFARLIGGGLSRPRTRAAAKTPAAPGLPDPLAHLVCKFWLGSPPRRANPAAPPASE